MRGFLALCASVLSFSAGFSADWAQYQGPNRDGTSPEKGILKSWPTAGPKHLWQVDIGEGYGGASIYQGKVYFMDRRDDAEDVMRCFDLKTGKQVWEVATPRPGRTSFNGSRGTPAVDGKHIFAMGPFGQFYAYDLKAQKLAWKVDFMTDFGSVNPRFGFAQSAQMFGDLLILAPLSETVGMVALEKETGKTVWQTQAITGSSYSSPKLVTLNGVQQLLLLTTGHLTSVDPKAGTILWQYDGYHCRNAIPDPTVLDDKRIFLTSGYDSGSSLIEVTHKKGDWTIKEVFGLDLRGAQVHTPILFKNHLYANFNTNENIRRKEPEGMVCLNLKGEVLWQTGTDPDFNRGNLIMVDGVILAQGGEDGYLRMIKPSPKGYKEIAAFQVFKDLKPRDNQIWAPMAFSNGKLVLRSQNQMKCLDLSKS